MLNIWIGNLGKYNEGELKGGWMELPKSKEEIDNFLKEVVGLNDEYEEYMINDYETDLPIKVDEYSNLTMLNLFALASERVYNMEAVEAYLDALSTDSIEEYINVMLQEDDIPFYSYEVNSDVLSNEEKYGMSKAILTGLQNVLDEQDVSDYFDYDRYGRDDEVTLYDSGYLDDSRLDEVNLNYYSLEEIKEELDYKEEQEENKKLKIVYKEVGKDPVEMEIDDTLEAKQKLVGGLIEVVPYKDDLLLICNEEGKITNLKPNIDIGYDYIAGNCFIVGDDYENAGFKSIEDNKIEEIKKDLKDRTIELEEIEEIEEDNMEF